MKGQRQGVRSTKQIEPTETEHDESYVALPHDSKRDVLIIVYNLKNTMYTDQTGKFPHISSLGNQYIMILHDVDINSSWAQALKNNTKGELILTRQRALTRMK